MSFHLNKIVVLACGTQYRQLEWRTNNEINRTNTFTWKQMMLRVAHIQIMHTHIWMKIIQFSNVIIVCATEKECDRLSVISIVFLTSKSHFLGKFQSNGKAMHNIPMLYANSINAIFWYWMKFHFDNYWSIFNKWNRVKILEEMED